MHAPNDLQARSPRSATRDANGKVWWHEVRASLGPVAARVRRGRQTVASYPIRCKYRTYVRASVRHESDGPTGRERHRADRLVDPGRPRWPSLWVSGGGFEGSARWRVVAAVTGVADGVWRRSPRCDRRRRGQLVGNASPRTSSAQVVAVGREERRERIARASVGVLERPARLAADLGPPGLHLRNE